MTVGTTESVITAQGNGVTTTFSYPFEIPNAGDAVVIFTDTDGTQSTLLSTQYTITGIGVSTGGTVTYPLSGSPIATGTLLTIQRLLPLIQTTSIQNQGPTFAAIEAELDYQMMVDQQLQEEADRTIQLNVADQNPLPQLPPAAQRANQILGFDGNGNPIVAQPSSALVSSAMQPVVAAASVTAAAALMRVVIDMADLNALRANTITASTMFVMVANYAVAGDGGGGLYWHNASDTTSADNGGTIIVDAASQRWYLETWGKPVSILQFGAKGDGVTDATSAIQACLTAAASQGFEVRIPIGKFLVSSTLTSGTPITVRGVNPGIGPGTVVSTSASIIVCSNSFTTGDIITVTGYESAIFSDFQIAGSLGLSYTSACPRSGGAGLRIIAPNPGVSINFGSVIEHMAFSGCFQGLALQLCGENTLVKDNYFQAWGDSSQALYIDMASGAHESSIGQVVENMFFGNPGSAQACCMEAHCGYGAVRANKFLGAQIGLAIYADQTIDIGSMMIALNSFEENSVKSLYITQNGPTITSIQVVNNQFSNIAQTNQQVTVNIQPDTGGAGSEIIDVDISGNNFNSHMPSASASFISILATNSTVTRNRGRVFAGGTYGITAQNGNVKLAVLDNEWLADGGTLTGTTGYLIQEATTVLRDHTSTAFTAALLPTAGNGSSLYVTDGQATSASNLTVVGAGSGVIAWRMRGAWLTVPIIG